MITKTLTFLNKKLRFKPVLGIVLGTGLNGLANILKDKTEIPYSDIPGFVESTAPSHVGMLIEGTIGGVPVILQQGRFHYYEGYSMDEVTYPIRVFKKLGIKTLVVTNAAGSLNQNMEPGSLVLLTDHINLMGTNPLIGPNKKEFGERFPSMHEPYSGKIKNKILAIAQNLDINIHQGVYAAVTGPSLETRAECKMIAGLGADLVGMSTVPEVITAVHSQIEVLGISSVTNFGNIFHSKAHSQQEIRDNAAIAQQNLKKLIIEFIAQHNE